MRLQLDHRTRERALLDLRIDGNIRGCDLSKLKINEGRHGSLVATRAGVIQQRAQRPVQFEIAAPTRELPGPTKLESTVRYLGIEVDDAIEIAEQIKI